MSPRPANPPPDRRQAILEAALRVFAAKGYTAATNNDIAREAGVTAAALYYYFPSKSDLFLAALTERKAQIFPTVEQVREQLWEMDPRVVLPFLVKSLLEFIAQPETRQLLTIILAEGPRVPEILAAWQEQVLGPALPLIFGYVQHQMEIGKLKPMEPRLLMLTLMGPVFSAVILRDILGLEAFSSLANDQVLQTLVDTVVPSLLASKE